jgi:hypothetical protein
MQGQSLTTAVPVSHDASYLIGVEERLERSHNKHTYHIDEHLK